MRLPFTLRTVAAALAVAFVLAGCAGGGDRPAQATITLPPSSPTPVPTVETIYITATPEPTLTPFPTNTPLPPTLTPEPSLTPTPAPNGQIAEGRGGLRIRTLPGDDSWVLGNLPEGSSVTIVGRTVDNAWLEVVSAQGVSGWVWGSYIAPDIDLKTVTVTNDTITHPTQAPYVANASASSNTAARPSNVVSGIGGTARQIYERGQQLGNRAAVFSKVGDSLTVATYVLYPFGWRTYSLGGYTYYQPAVDYFSAVIARDGKDSFSNISLAADNGWTSADILDPGRANPQVCGGGETPLACEYRLVRPSIALVMVGTNDVSMLSAEAFSANLAHIVEVSRDMGVIPCLSTIPTRVGFEGAVQQFNQIVIATARQYDVPLMDYFTAMLPLPNNGMSSDGVHPSWPPGEYSDSARFTGNNLNYGYAMRNFVLLQALDAIWRQALY